MAKNEILKIEILTVVNILFKSLHCIRGTLFKRTTLDFNQSSVVGIIIINNNDNDYNHETESHFITLYLCHFQLLLPAWSWKNHSCGSGATPFFKNFCLNIILKVFIWNGTQTISGIFFHSSHLCYGLALSVYIHLNGNVFFQRREF